jgi:hypothetical protein
MTLVVAHRRSTRALAEKGDRIVHDVTSRAPEPWVRFSPFFPHGGIPVPFTSGRTAMSVEGIWQALKVFATADVDESKLDVKAMRGIKRTERELGRVLGHRRGLTPRSDPLDLLGYVEARRQIYLPSYRWVLDHRLADLVERLRAESESHEVVLLDYSTNGDVEDVTRPLSHATLVCSYVRGEWPG